ncbi:MAG: phosphonate C-P lyase system protein PhnG [Mesorhizobium sp.]|mgnify:CR=1 FL=1|nr:phosphonate C-P lyase system protein PhnG [Mesorhizobium sp.]MCO5162471.1 phosphonate C-P lyase system protein PhnG [Mesorhizobium sp.]
MQGTRIGTRPDSDARREMMAVLAHAPSSRLAGLWRDAGFDAAAEPVRGPETGLVTVRGRIGGGGAPFNVGEATVTRATVRLAGGEVGHSYALGRDADKARIAATIDALWQKPELRPRLEDLILAPLRREHDANAVRRAAEVAATKVDFFTMVRGED